MNPGSNLLTDAFSLIETTPVLYYKYTSRSLNEFRQWVSVYDEAITIEGSVQAVPRSKYAYLGLDFQKNYVNLFAALNATNIDRDVSGDQFEWNGSRYQIESESGWYAQDGWMEALGVEITKGT